MSVNHNLRNNVNDLHMFAISKKQESGMPIQCKVINLNTPKEKIAKYRESGRLLFLDRKEEKLFSDFEVMRNLDNKNISIKNLKLVDKKTQAVIAEKITLNPVLDKLEPNLIQQQLLIKNKIFEWEWTDETLLSFVIQADLKADEKNSFGKTILSVAAENGSEKALSYLLEHGAKEETLHAAMKDALFPRYRKFNKTTIQKLIEKGAMKSAEGNTPPPVKKALFDYVEIPFKVTNEQLISAGRDDEYLIYLVDKAGLKADDTNSEGESLLFASVKNGRKDLVSHLLKKGASNECVNAAFTAVFSPRLNKKREEIVPYEKEIFCSFMENGVASEIAKEEIFKQILTPPDQFSGHRTCGITDRNLIYLFEQGYIKIDDVNSKGQGVLFAALTGGRPTLAFYLMEKGADVNAKYEGCTPLHAAILHGRLMKTDKIAEVEAPHYESGCFSDNRGMMFSYRKQKDGSALFLTSDIMSIDTANRIVEKLIEKKADVNCKTKEGDTLLHLAIRDFTLDNFWKKDKALLEILLKESPAAINDSNEKKETPLSLACSIEFRQLYYSYKASNYRYLIKELNHSDLENISIANHDTFFQAMDILNKVGRTHGLIDFLMERGATMPTKL